MAGEEWRVEAIDRRLERLYGAVEWAKAGGLLQVAAIAEPGRRVIAIGAAAPASPTDRFVLGVARARSDAIVTSGAVLRAEPELVHRLGESREEEAALQAWRAHRLGRSRAPWLVVLTRSGTIPVGHPAIRSATGGLVWTSAAGRARLGARVGRLDVVAGADARPAAQLPEDGGAGLTRAIEHVRAQPAVETVLIEAGPSLTRPLYGEPRRLERLPGAPLLDELLLSCFEGTLAPDAVGPAFVSGSAVRQVFPQPPRECRVDEPSGPWCFQRYRRRASLGMGSTQGERLLKRLLKR